LRFGSRSINCSGTLQTLDAAFESGVHDPSSTSRVNNGAPNVFSSALSGCPLSGVKRTVDVRQYPYIGFSSVTLVFAGEIMQRDTGVEQAIRRAISEPVYHRLQ
jgi:hypothetical protein